LDPFCSETFKLSLLALVESICTQYTVCNIQNNRIQVLPKCSSDNILGLWYMVSCEFDTLENKKHFQY